MLMFVPRVQRSAQSGLSLVELLVAMALGVMLSGGAIGAYMASKQQYLYDDQLARVQENGRYAVSLLQRELSMAGFYAGLVSTTELGDGSVGVDCNSLGWALHTQFPLDVVDNHRGSGVPTTQHSVPLTCVNGSRVVDGSDVIAVKRSAAEASLSGGVPRAGLTLSRVSRWHMRLEPGAEPLWQQLRPADLPAVGVSNPAHAYWEARASVLYLRDYAQSPGDNLPTLCAEVLAGDAMTSRCFVEGVEDLQLEVGVDSDGDGVVNVYRMNPSAADLRAAVVVRAHLLLRSLHTVPGARLEKTYYLGSKEVRPGADGFLRRVFSTTVRLQNLRSATYTLAVG
ncbi:MAG: hypothetical protein Hals2KO_30010 [Halioglobus sp.]